jgi:peptidyl-prolyl cis-trans isomerase B (cyclophilin B)
MKKFAALFLLTAFTSLAFAQVKKTTTTSANTTTVKKPITKPTAKPIAKPVAKPVVKTKIDKEVKIKITTDSGIIVIKLYDSTPLHRDNFVKLVKQGFYDSLMFHRVIPNFMIQGGDPTSKYAQQGSMLGSGGGEMERIPAEFNSSYIHKKGALAAARDNNPEKKSSACQFYIVQGDILTDETLTQLEDQSGKKYTWAQRNIYKSIGGTPFLDNNYTVFGETISGLDVVNKIATTARDGANRPISDLRMKMEIMK